MGNSFGRSKNGNPASTKATSMKDLLNDLDVSIAHKQAVVNNWGAYYYNAKVPYEHKFKVSVGGWNLGWVWKTETRYRDEQRFDQGRYDRDVASADQRIQTCKNTIERTISSAKTQLANIEQNKTSTTSEIPLLTQKLEHFNSQYQIKCGTAKNLERELTFQREKSNASSQNLANQQHIVTNLSGQVASTKQQLGAHEQLLVTTKTKLHTAEKQFNQMHSALRGQLELLSNQQRAYLFAEQYGDQEKQFMLEIIDSIGFDAGHLGYYSIAKNSKDLMELALYKGINFGSYCYDGKTLLQHLATSGNQELLNFVTSLATQDFATTLSVAIEQNDLQTMKAILSCNSYLLSDLNQKGLSLLHVAIASSRPEVVELLLELDETMITILSSNMESAFSIALRQKNTEVIEILLPSINIASEIKILQERGNIHLLENIKNSDFGLEPEMLELINKTLLGEESFETVANQQNDIELIALLDNYDI